MIPSDSPERLIQRVAPALHNEEAICLELGNQKNGRYSST
jgi:hypothetical protein